MAGMSLCGWLDSGAGGCPARLGLHEPQPGRSDFMLHGCSGSGRRRLQWQGRMSLRQTGEFETAKARHIMKLTEYDVNNPYTTTLVSTERITPLGWEAEVRHLVLRLPDTPFDYVEGQSIGVLAPGPHEFGNSHHLRLYSIASPGGGDDGRGDTISICVRRCFSIDDIKRRMLPGPALPTSCAMPTPATPSPSPVPTACSSKCRPTTTPISSWSAPAPASPCCAFVKHIYQRHGEWKGRSASSAPKPAWADARHERFPEGSGALLRPGLLPRLRSHQPPSA